MTAQVNDAVLPDDEPASEKAPLPRLVSFLGYRYIAILVLLIFSALLFASGQMKVPPLDRDEPRFAQASKQMLETGDYVNIRFQDEARNKKPVGIYWLQVAAAKATGYDQNAPIWVYRLPSYLAAIASVLLAYWVARGFMSAPAAFVCGLLVAMTIILNVEARLAKTDAAMLACIMLSQGALARAFLKDNTKRSWWLAFLFWSGVGFATLIKGPVGPMVVGLTVLGLFAVRRKIDFMRVLAPLSGIIYALFIVVPWLVAIYIATDGGFFQEALGKDFLAKIASGQESHGAPPLTYLLISFGVFWPLFPFLIMSLPQIWRERRQKVVVFALCWLLPSWLVFELVPTKLPHYTMPLMPALAMLSAYVLVEKRFEISNRIVRWASGVLLALPALLVASATIVGPVYLGDWPSPPGVVLCVLAAIAALYAAGHLVKDQALKAVGGTMLASLLLMAGFWGFSGPALDKIWISSRLVSAIEKGANCAHPKLLISGLYEPSLVFLNGTDTVLANHGGAEFLKEAPSSCRIAVIDRPYWQSFKDEAQKIGLQYHSVGQVKGLNINGGDDVDLMLYQEGAAKVDG